MSRIEKWFVFLALAGCMAVPVWADELPDGVVVHTAPPAAGEAQTQEQGYPVAISEVQEEPTASPQPTAQPQAAEPSPRMGDSQLLQSAGLGLTLAGAMLLRQNRFHRRKNS